ncbi:hypothetical protein Mosig_00076 [Pelagibacter phage Mosig EXVC030M]|nr:hypothetical protein Mosig_00076 [Pelagibacter phage Mosig EXVC030M]
MIKGVAEYLNIKHHKQLYETLYNLVKTKDNNTFGKTPFVSYSLEDNRTGKPTGYEKTFWPLLNHHKLVHPHYQFRSTGFNTADSTEKDVFPHTDIDLDTEHPNGYNIVVPVHGNSKIVYYETKEEEIYLPEKNAHGHAYYHEFYAQKEMGQGTPEFEKFLSDREIGHIVVDKPLLIKTDIMHRVVITEAPRCAWVTRWNNIPKDVSFQEFKQKVESIL